MNLVFKYTLFVLFLGSSFSKLGKTKGSQSKKSLSLFKGTESKELNSDRNQGKKESVRSGSFFEIDDASQSSSVDKVYVSKKGKKLSQSQYKKLDGSSAKLYSKNNESRFKKTTPVSLRSPLFSGCGPNIEYDHCYKIENNNRYPNFYDSCQKNQGCKIEQIKYYPREIENVVCVKASRGPSALTCNQNILEPFLCESSSETQCEVSCPRQNVVRLRRNDCGKNYNKQNNCYQTDYEDCNYYNPLQVEQDCVFPIEGIYAPRQSPQCNVSPMVVSRPCYDYQRPNQQVSKAYDIDNVICIRPIFSTFTFNRPPIPCLSIDNPVTTTFINCTDLVTTSSASTPVTTATSCIPIGDNGCSTVTLFSIVTRPRYPSHSNLVMLNTCGISPPVVTVTSSFICTVPSSTTTVTLSTETVSSTVTTTENVTVTSSYITTAPGTTETVSVTAPPVTSTSTIVVTETVTSPPVTTTDD